MLYYNHKEGNKEFPQGKENEKMKKKNMIPALCYTTPANRNKSYLYTVGTLEAMEKMMNEWNAHGNPNPYYRNAGEGAIYHIEYVEDYWD